jgi:predicted transcriptional regulator of viral defense system
MQPIKRLSSWLYENANATHYLFRLKDLIALFPDQSDAAFRTLLSRAATTGLLIRVCRGIYLFKKPEFPVFIVVNQAFAARSRQNAKKSAGLAR